jgi:hypothetical protein
MSSEMTERLVKKGKPGHGSAACTCLPDTTHSETKERAGVEQRERERDRERGRGREK